MTLLNTVTSMVTDPDFSLKCLKVESTNRQNADIMLAISRRKLRSVETYVKSYVHSHVYYVIPSRVFFLNCMLLFY